MLEVFVLERRIFIQKNRIILVKAAVSKELKKRENRQVCSNLDSKCVCFFLQNTETI